MPTTDIEVGAPLTGEFTAELVDSSGVEPKDVIRRTDVFSIKCTWYIEGGLASSLGGTWYVQAAFDAIGPGAKFRSEEHSVPLDGKTGPDDRYEFSITVPAGENFPNGIPKVEAGERSEPYQVTALLTYTDVLGKPGPMAASVNLEELTIYA